jgi:hypothetical protein
VLCFEKEQQGRLRASLVFSDVKLGKCFAFNIVGTLVSQLWLTVDSGQPARVTLLLTLKAPFSTSPLSSIVLTVRGGFQESET